MPGDRAGDALLLQPLVFVARLVRDGDEARPLPRRRLPLHVLLLCAGTRRHAHTMRLQARAPRAPHLRRPSGTVLPSGLRLQGLPLELAVRARSVHAFLAICIPRSRSFALASLALTLRRCGSCGEAYDEHTTIFETAADRARAGKATESNLGGWSNEKPHLDAVCGGVTRMSSLLTGVERAGIGPLQHTDGMTCVPCDENAAPITPFSSTAEVFANYDRKADAHVARLRKLKEARESLQFAGGSHGQRLGHQGAASTNSSSNASSGGGKALVPRPPAGGAGAVRPGAGGRSSASTTTGGTAAARPVVNSNRPPTKAAMRELAAAAAEARFGGSEAAAEEAPRPPPARTVAAAAPSPAPSKRATATARGGPGGTTRSSAGGPRGQAKLAVAAARRERAAGAAEARMSVAAEA